MMKGEVSDGFFWLISVNLILGGEGIDPPNHISRKRRDPETAVIYCP